MAVLPDVNCLLLGFLESDLNVSDDSETELGSLDVTSNKKPTVIPPKLREGETRGGMSSGSDSSTGSDSSSESDGETSSSEDEAAKEPEKQEVKKEEEQCPTPKENHSWGLKGFLNQLKQSSPEAPLLKKSTEKQKEIDKTNDDLLDNILHSTMSSQHTLKEIGHTATLPFSTDHLDPDFDSDSNLTGADSGCHKPHDNTDKTGAWKQDSPNISDSVSSKSSASKPEKKGRGRPSNSSLSSDSVSKKSTDNSSSKSNSGANKSKTTPKKDGKKDKSKSSQEDKKRYKSKATISDSDDSEIDVVSVTPEVKTSAPTSNTSPGEKDKFRSKLFSSPKANKSSPVKVSQTQEKENSSFSKDKEKGKDGRHKISSHRKKDRDRDKDKSDNSDKSKKNDHKKALSPNYVNDIITNVKPQSLLSPIPTFSSPTKHPLSPSPGRTTSPTCPRLTYSKGKPAIMVDISLAFLERVPSSAPSPSASPRTSHPSDVADTHTDKHIGAKTPDISHKKPDIPSKCADATSKSADKSQKHSDSFEKKHEASDKSVKMEKTSSKHVDKSAKNVEKSAEKCVEKSTEKNIEKSAEKSANSDKSASSVDKSSNKVERSECKLEEEADASEDVRDSEAGHQDKASRSHKRKSTSDKADISSSNKRHKSTSKSSRKSSSSESLHNGSSNSSGQPESQENGTSSKSSSSSHTAHRERRGSTSSTSSRHSTSGSKHKKIKLEDKVKKDPPSPDKQSKKEKIEVSQQNGQDHLPFTSYNDGTVKSEPRQNGPRLAPQCVEERLEPAEKYLSKAKELKHLADKDKPAKFSLYVKSVLSFVQCGCAMEKEAISEPQKIFTMYHDTLQLLKQVIRVRGTCIDPDVPINDKRLSVLLSRIQSLLCLKLYNLKRPEVMKFKKIIDADNNKTAASAKSPHQSTIYSRSIGTPPPISPTPSPAGSIGSVGSQGSCELPSSKLTNGNLSSANTPMSSPGTVSVSQRIHSVTQQYIHLTGYFVTGHDLWLQAEDAAQDFKEFFNMLDNTCGPLSLHSSVLHLVRYVNEGLQTMKDT